MDSVDVEAMHNEYGLTWLDSVDVEPMSPTQVSRWTMYARYGFMELRIKEAVWRFESVYASIFDTTILGLVALRVRSVLSQLVRS